MGDGRWAMGDGPGDMEPVQRFHSRSFPVSSQRALAVLGGQVGTYGE